MQRGRGRKETNLRVANELIMNDDGIVRGDNGLLSLVDRDLQRECMAYRQPTLDDVVHRAVPLN